MATKGFRSRVMTLLVLAATSNVDVALSNPSAPVTQMPVSRLASPDQMLSDIHKSLAANNLAMAQQQADALVKHYPTFKVGHAMQADILMLHAGAMPGFSGTNGAIMKLQAEAKARLQAAQRKPDAHAYPLNALQTASDVKTLLFVDTQQSRLYVYTQSDGSLKYIADYYVGLGEHGVLKKKAGDRKTPIGIYTITQWVTGAHGATGLAKLPGNGSGALGINYPNEWDRSQGSTGGGITIRGLPYQTFSVPPFSSDGSLLLNHQDLQQLARLITPGRTPIIIAEKIEFGSRALWDAQRLLAQGLLQHWRAVVAIKESSPQLLHNQYWPSYTAQHTGTVAQWAATRKSYVGEPRDVTSYVYPANQRMLMISFTLDEMHPVTKQRTSIRKRQFWLQDRQRQTQDNHGEAVWKILLETTL